jgi:hypothetical protein
MFPAKALCRTWKFHLQAGPSRRGSSVRHHLGTPGDFTESASHRAATGSRNARPRANMSHRHQLACHRPKFISRSRLRDGLSFSVRLDLAQLVAAHVGLSVLETQDATLAARIEVATHTPSRTSTAS